MAHGIRPSALILGKDSGKPWTKWDVALAKAYQRFLNELCSQCGLPKYICHSNDNRIQFRSMKDDCASLAVSERKQAQMAEDKNATNYGIKVYAEPYLIDAAVEAGLEFSDFRRPYLMEQAKKQGLLPEEFEVKYPVSGNPS